MKYDNVNILAPMVRVGTLPLRMLALEYGADIVYNEELVDRRMLECKRVENNILKTVDFCIAGEGEPIFRTCAKEKERLVFQIGTCSPERAVQVAKLLENDVSAIDVNMGCPKAFSVQGGMGAALLTNPDLASEILSSLVAAVNIPITCKIRILPTLEDTLALVHGLERSGISAMTVHGRTRSERPRHANHDDVIREIQRALAIPTIANGGSEEIQCYDDIAKFRQRTGCSSVMLARSALRNASVFRPDGLLEVYDVIKRYLCLAVDYDMIHQNAKYVLQGMLREEQQTTERGQKVLAAQNMAELCDVYGLKGYYEEVFSRRRDREGHARLHQTADQEQEDDLPDAIKLPVTYIRKRNKQHAEQAAALTAITHLNLLPATAKHNGQS